MLLYLLIPANVSLRWLYYYNFRFNFRAANSLCKLINIPRAKSEQLRCFLCKIPESTENLLPPQYYDVIIYYSAFGRPSIRQTPQNTHTRCWYKNFGGKNAWCVSERKRKTRWDLEAVYLISSELKGSSRRRFVLQLCKSGSARSCRLQMGKLISTCRLWGEIKRRMCCVRASVHMHFEKSARENYMAEFHANF